MPPTIRLKPERSPLIVSVQYLFPKILPGHQATLQMHHLGISHINHFLSGDGTHRPHRAVNDYLGSLIFRKLAFEMIDFVERDQKIGPFNFSFNKFFSFRRANYVPNAEYFRMNFITFYNTLYCVSNLSGQFKIKYFSCPKAKLYTFYPDLPRKESHSRAIIMHCLETGPLKSNALAD